MPTLTVDLDTSQSPELAEWGAKAVEVSVLWWPHVLNALGQAPYDKHITLVVRPDVGPPAYCTNGNEIHCNADWFGEHPEDLGAVVHEVVHAAQSYPTYEPGWLVEGIADYVRYCVMEPESRWATADLAKASWTNGYGPCGMFLGWLSSTFDATLVHRLDAALKADAYSDSLLTEVTGGRDWAALWPEFLASRGQVPDPEVDHSGARKGVETTVVALEDGRFQLTAEVFGKALDLEYGFDGDQVVDPTSATDDFTVEVDGTQLRVKGSFGEFSFDPPREQTVAA